MSFDPYHQWLGIPPEHRPPDCYQLLGIRRFEQNPTVISHAAERQLLMLKSLQNGPHGALTQQLMNEVTAARVRLLDPQKKDQYDAELRQRGRKRATPPPPVSPDPSVTPSPQVEQPGRPLIEEPEVVASTVHKQSARNREGGKTARHSGPARMRIGRWIAAAAVVALGLTLGVVWMVQGASPLR